MDTIKERLLEIVKRRKEIEVEVLGGKLKLKELESLEEEVEELNEEEIDLRTKAVGEANKQRTEIKMESKKEVEKTNENPYASVEYRSAFRDYVVGKTKEVEYRADATTLTSDIGAIIPTTITDKVVEELKSYGQIVERISFSNFKGGVDIPVKATTPAASWEAEGSVAEKQKQAYGKISFGYKKLQVRVAISLIASVVSLDVWEREVAKDVAKALVLAIEEAVIKGTADGQPRGLINDIVGTNNGRIPVANVKDLKAADLTYAGWLGATEGAIPEGYEDQDNVILMNKATFFTNVLGLVDDNKQPIARVDRDLNGKPLRYLFGLPVIFTSHLPAYSTASANAIFGAVLDLKNYVFNSNLELQYKRYFDENTDEWVFKGTLIGDGRLADTNGVILLKKTT